MTAQEVSVLTTQEVANRFYELAKLGNWDRIQEELFARDAKSIEPAHAQGLKSVSGMDNLKEKARQWEAMIEKTHGGYCNEPQVAGNYFSCTMGADITMKGQGRVMMDEVAVYEVKDGKITAEQFFY
jgi:hypothetical protein